MEKNLGNTWYIHVMYAKLHSISDVDMSYAWDPLNC